MEIQLRLFASLRAQIGVDGERLVLEAPLTVGGLRNHLAGRGDPWALLADPSVQAAVNHERADDATPLSEGAEVAFFPPVTGG